MKGFLEKERWFWLFQTVQHPRGSHGERLSLPPNRFCGYWTGCHGLKGHFAGIAV